MILVVMYMDGEAYFASSVEDVRNAEEIYLCEDSIDPNDIDYPAILYRRCVKVVKA